MATLLTSQAPSFPTRTRTNGKACTIYKKNLFFSLSKPTFKDTFNLEKNGLNSVYAHVFGEAKYAAHNAYGYVQALSDIFITSKFWKILEKRVKVIQQRVSINLEERRDF